MLFVDAADNCPSKIPLRTYLEFVSTADARDFHRARRIRYYSSNGSYS